ncbi:MAG: hypothetical protein KO463_00615 [Candidatus Methanofastidiosa archaeon]|nr:hypothetical protein [Candidatus Methanofastidiosa archaeon]
MRRPTVIDAIIALILLFSLYSFLSAEAGVYRQVDEYYYTGSQIYKATNYMAFLDSKGFLYEAEIRGYWWSDYLEFRESGYVIDTGEGSFSLLRTTGEVVTIGGRMSYKEQIGASEIRLIIKTSSVVTARMYSAGYPSFDDYLATVRDTTSFLDRFSIDDVAITGSVSFDAQVTPSRVTEAELEDLLRKELYYVKGITVSTTPTGITLSIEQGTLTELAAVPALLASQGIEMGPVFVSDATVIVRTLGEIGELDKYGIKRHIADELADVLDADENAIHIRL